jgi:hypothetical protein
LKTTKRKTTVADLTIFARNDYTKLELSTKAFTFAAVADRNCNLKDWKTKRRKTSELDTLTNHFLTTIPKLITSLLVDNKLYARLKNAQLITTTPKLVTSILCRQLTAF